MTKKSPLQRVREEHGSKDELATKVLDILEVPEGEDPADFEHRIGTLSNRKLIRLWQAHQTLDEKYDSREDLVEKITRAMFPGGNEDYARKISGFTVPKLLDLARRYKV